MTVEDVARDVAYDVLLAVDVDAAYANLLLPRLLRERRIEHRDAAFATELSYGALRRQGVLDIVLAHGSRRPIAELDPSVRAALRLGAYQLLHTRVPAHAAVHATVALARARAGHRVVGLVNAVLRRVGERSWSQWIEQLAPTDDVGRIAFTHGYPRWVADTWLDALGGDVEELADALADERPVTHLVARPGGIDRDELLSLAGPDAVAGPWSPYAVRMSGGDPGDLAPVRDGRAAVQDEGSQLAALALVRAGLDGPERNWLDMCAGPGGKAALLAACADEGTRLLAADVQPHRAGLVAAAVRAGADVVVADGTAPAWRPSSFDRVLVDAPCTGLGALRRRPEVRWRRRPEDVPGLQQLQRRLLDQAIESCRPGGVVAYVTCSPHPAETREVVAACHGARRDLEPIDVRPLLSGVPHLGDGPDVQLWPHRHATDAMYVALMRRLPVVDGVRP